MKKARKGFTLVELLIVVAIIGVLAAMMNISAGSSTASARAATIYNNIRSIRMGGLLYQVQQGDAFKESEVSDSALRDNKILDLNTYNQNSNGQEGNIKYKIVEGVDATEDAATQGAYVICQFKDDAERVAIAKALQGYKDIRVDDSAYTAGAFIYHFTPYTQNTSDYEYDRDMTY